MIYDDLDTIAANSFRNFHAKGLDYLCLHRSPELTIKAYFYAGNGGPEVVCPHDHRYAFSTHVLAGESGHIRYTEDPCFARRWTNYQRFNWRTPLLGGNGFEWAEGTHLERYSHEEYRAGDSYWCRSDEIHTIAINRHDTVLLLYQHADELAPDVPTCTYVYGDSKEPPVLSGLYDSMTLACAEMRLSHIKELLGNNPRQPTTRRGSEEV